MHFQSVLGSKLTQWPQWPAWRLFADSLNFSDTVYIDALQNKSITCPPWGYRCDAGIQFTPQKLIRAKLDLSESVPDCLFHPLHEETSTFTRSLERLVSTVSWVEEAANGPQWVLVLSRTLQESSRCCAMVETFSTTVRSRDCAACEMNVTVSTGTSVTPNLLAAAKNRGTQQLGWDQWREWVIKTNLKCHLSTYSLCLGIA